MVAFGAFLGLLTAISWALSSIIHPHISKTLGVHSCMMLRQPLAVVVLAILCLVMGQFHHASGYTLFMAIFSGMLGVALADWCIYESVLRVGVRTALVCASLSSCLTAILSFFLLDEVINFQGVVGIVIATAGVMLVVFTEHSAPSQSLPKPTLKQELMGIALALAGALGLALAFITSKEALNEGMTSLYLTLLRNVGGCAAIWFMAAYVHNIKSTWSNFSSHPELIKFFLLGCIFGPVGGVWLASAALLFAPAAIVATVIGLQPIACTVISAIIEKRLPSWGSILGCCIACTGAAILLLRNM